MRKNATYELAIAVAADLRSEQGENYEYDRALCEVISDMFGVGGEGGMDDGRAIVAQAAGIKEFSH